jgi:hypothetical protein
MTLRLVFGLGWSLVTGLAGTWLTLAPWAQGEQGGGDWTTVTRGEVFAGIGLVALAAIGVVVVLAQLVGSLREVGVIAPQPARGRDSGATSSPEMEKALIALAQALAEDLDAQRTPAADARPGAESPGGAGWREQK